MTDLQSFDKLLSESEPLIENLDHLPWETVSGLYSLYGELAKSATSNINRINAEIRAIVCDRWDKILERVVDTLPDDFYDKIPDKPKCVLSPALSPVAETTNPIWINAHLLKGIGLSVYLLAKEFGARPTMLFGTKPEDYPFLSVLPDLKMEYLEHDREMAYAEYVKQYYSHMLKKFTRMDALIFYGMYPATLLYLNSYRKFRPDGKVYCMLDMNSDWMKRIPWDAVDIRKFGEQCDVLATSCRYLRDELNRNPKVNFPCRWLPNAFYNPTDIEIIADSNYKENVILTVGRIGTWQKNSEELLIAFAGVSNKLKDWILKLAGPIEPKFNDFIEKYFHARPELRSSVIFTGEITDKSKLYDEYAKAKIFILTSRVEAAPNVCVEALHHGCKFITSNIDPADDITNYGELGVIYKSGDINALSDALVKLCSNSDKEEFDRHIPKTAAYSEKYFKWNRNIKKLKFMLYGLYNE
ncbi:MAG: glycosyltransferase [Acidobacteriota bacterium]|nr:glycosyltransferase [Acidobacteriota bacterium]